MDTLESLYKEELINNRRKFRRLAEVGWLEMNTTIEIIKYLKSLGYNVIYGRKIHSSRMGLPSEAEFKEHIKNVNTDNLDFNCDEILEGYTGCICQLECETPGKTFCFRFDIDALPLHESDDEKHIPNKLNFRSLDNNTSHSCGHDGHIAIGLMLAKYVMENKNTLKGKYRFIFQPAEEGVRGAKSITNTEFLNNIDYLFASHIGMNEKPDTVGIGTENFLATIKYDVNFKGVSSHAGGSPEKGKNALLAACSCSLNLHTLPQYGNGIARVNVGTLNAGTGRNLVPQNADMKLEIRADKKEILNNLKIKTENIIKHSALCYDLKYSIKEVGSAAAFTSRHRDFLEELSDYLESKNLKIHRFPDFNSSEDVSYMLEKVENSGGIGIHFLFGTELKAPHHNDAFDYNENVLMLGLKSYVESIKYINSK